MYAMGMSKAASGGGKRQQVNDHATTDTATTQVLLICCVPSCYWATLVAQRWLGCYRAAALRAASTQC